MAFNNNGIKNGMLNVVLWAEANRGKGASFLPTNIASLAAWYDADSSYITKDGADRVSAWTARFGGVALDLSQGTAANQPLWQDSEVNGLPAVCFAKSRADSMASANNNLLDNQAGFTGFYVFKITSPENYGRMWIRETNTTDRVSFSHGGPGNGDNQGNLLNMEGPGSTTGSKGVIASIYTPGTYYYATHRFDGTGATDSDKLRLWRDGNEQSLTYSGTLPTATANNNTNFQVGTEGGLSWDGSIAEMIFYHEALSDADRLQVENYIANKYAMT